MAKKTDRNLPDWAEAHPDNPNVFYVDPDKFYPVLLEELGAEQTDQYWLEVAYQCMKMDMQGALGRFNFEIRVKAGDGYKDRWALKNHPSGRGVKVATQGREARGHYKRLRGHLPS